jgi:rSAM/selenodomain-associated transferase 1
VGDALVIVGKAPEPGRAKTRLVPPLSPQQAADLYAAFLLDIVDVGLGLGWSVVSMVHPSCAADLLRQVIPPAVSLVPQRGAGLEAALKFAFEYHFDRGFERVVVIGSDNPTLRSGPIRHAAAALQRSADVAIGPSEDGGYYLIGLRALQLGLFESIHWSTPWVYRQTVERAVQLGLQVHEVETWYDVDEPADLERLSAELAASSNSIAPRTRAALAQLGAGTSTVGVRPEADAYACATRLPTPLPQPARARTTTAPPNPPPVIRAP